MKATELMIGDYVSVTPSGMTIKIAASHKRKVAYHACINKLSWVREGLLIPIPLTKEILEKNGFELREGCTSAWDWGHGETSIHVSGTPDCPVGQTLTIYISGHCAGAAYSSYRVVNDLVIRGVHELQHALKLCGIKKEIEL